MSTSGQFRALKDEAAAAAARGDRARALELYDKLALSDPSEPRYVLRCAEMLRDLNRPREAVERFRQAAETYAASGFELKAVAACKLALQLTPDDRETRRLLETLLPTTSTERPSRPSIRPYRSDRPPMSSTGPGAGASGGGASGGSSSGAATAAARRSERPEPRREMPTLESIQVARQLPGTARDAGSGIVEIELSWSEDAGPDPTYKDVPPIEVQRTVKRDPDSTGELDAGDDLFAKRSSGTMSKARPKIDPSQIRGLPLIGKLPNDALENFLQRVEVRTAAPGDRVVTEGAPADEVFLVVHGDLVATRGTPPRALARLGDSTFFGEMALLDDTPRSATVTAVTDVELLVLPRDLVLEICDLYPNVLATLMQSLRTRLIATLTATSPLLASIPRSERLRIVERFRYREVEPGTMFIRQGQRADGLYILLTGRADVLVDGREVASLTTGDIVGEMSCLAAGPAHASVRARSRLGALSIPAAELQELTMVHPQVLEHLASLSASRQDELVDLRAEHDLGGRSVRRV